MKVLDLVNPFKGSGRNVTTIESTNFERVDMFNYLGTRKIESGHEKVEIHDRIAKELKSLGAMNTILKSKNMSGRS